MHILLTNDDGLFAPGLAAVHGHLAELGHVSVVAPSKPQSGAGHSISLEPLVCEELDIMGKFTAYSVDGSPADCVKMALNGLIEPSCGPIDLVVSGINHGANVGIHVFYSGTVAAAVEAAFYGVPSIALSAMMEDNFDVKQAARYGCDIVRQLLPLQAGDVINVNIPELSKQPPRGIVVAPQSTGGFDERFEATGNKHSRIVFEYAGGSHRKANVSPADTTSLLAGYITVTALHFDMTNHKRNRSLERIAWKIPAQR